jgi:hypothetical protein
MTADDVSMTAYASRQLRMADRAFRAGRCFQHQHVEQFAQVRTGRTMEAAWQPFIS